MEKPAGTSQNQGTSQDQIFKLPDMPSEHNILSHQATQWIESAEALLRGKGLWEVAQGGLPSAARNIVDTTLSTLAPIGGVITHRED